MHTLRNILNFYVYSNLHVALAGFCITKLTLIKYGYFDNITPLFVGFSIIFSYNFIRFYEIKKDGLSWFRNWFFEHSKILVLLSFLSFLATIYLVFFKAFNLKALFVLIPFGFMTLFYVLPIFKFKNSELSFRNFPRIKIFSIAFSWAGVSVLFPLYEKGVLFNLNIWIEFIQRTFILMAIIIPFDIRDANSDGLYLKTIPQTLGIKSAKLVAYSLLVLFLSLELIKSAFSFWLFLPSFLIAPITASFVYFSNSSQSRFYTAFWIESIPIVWFVLIVLFSS